MQIEEIDKPLIENDRQILIKMKAAGINPVDTKLRKQGSFSAEQMPVILGCDGAGVVEEVGQAVTKFKVGDSVYFCNGGLGAKNTGCYAQYAVVSEHRLAKKPESISFTDAAAFPAALITAWESLYDRGRLCANSKVLIHGGAGGSAKYIDQGKLKVHVSQTYPLSQANQAHELVETGSVTGKVVLNID